MINHQTIKSVAVLAICAASAIACGGSSSESAAETSPAKEADHTSQGGEGRPDGTSTADDQPGGSHTMPDGTTMENDEMAH